MQAARYAGREGSKFDCRASDLDDATVNRTVFFTYLPQVCEIASNIFGSWIEDSSWLNHVIVNHIDTSVLDLTGYQLSGDSPEDIGYVQVGCGFGSQLDGSLKTQTCTQDPLLYSTPLLL